MATEVPFGCRNLKWLGAIMGRSLARTDGGGRFVLWIDGVGGFLVCESPAVRIGQAVPGCGLELPLLADVSRHHATLRRDHEEYLLEPIRETHVNARVARELTTLASGSVVQLGVVQFRFERRHPLSATARLDFLSHHHTVPSSRAVLLMAETLLLGPEAKSHVACRGWKQEVVLFRRDGVLQCRTEGPFEVDGRRKTDRAAITRRSRVVGDHFSFTLEQLD